MSTRPGGRTALRLVLLAAACWLARGRSETAWGGQGEGVPVAGGRAVEQGIAVDLAISALAGGGPLREGQDVAVSFRVSYAATGQAIPGLSPAAWLDRPATAEAAIPGCASRVKELAGGSLFGQAELDLNSYYVLALNEDASINVVDPLFGFAGSKLLTSIPLLSPGEDWALAANGKSLFVSQPEADRVAAIDTDTWKVVAQVAAGRHPTRVAMQPDGARLWSVVEEAGKDLAVIDAREPRLVARIATGKGPHELAFSADGALVFVTNTGASTVSVVDARQLKKVADLVTASRPKAIAYSSLAAAAYVVAEDGSVVAMDGRGRAVGKPIAAGAGVGAIRFAPGGRFAFLLNPRQDTVQVIDARVNGIVTAGSVRQGPDQVVFSDQLAYIRHRGSDSVLMVPLRTLGEEGHRLEAADFTGGQQPFGSAARTSLADGIAPAPSPGAVLVANPADRAIYYYAEGMAAPSGTFHNYGRQPLAVLVVDRGLRERALKGSYETTVRLPGAGHYRIPFFLDAPRMIHCFEVEVLPDPELVAARSRLAPVQVEPLLAERRVAVGSAVKLRFRLTDPASGSPATGVHDLVMMAHTMTGDWQVREVAREVASDAGQGLYEAEFVPPAVGLYAVIVECRSRHLPFHLSPRVVLEATPAAPAAARAPAQQEPSATPLSIPDVALTDQDGRPVRFYSDLVKGRKVAMNFVFTTCTTICPPMGASFRRLQELLGKRAGEEVQLISVSIDPEVDTPGRLKIWGARFNAGPGWRLVTGRRVEVERLLKGLGVYTPDRNAHAPLVLLGNEPAGSWTRVDGFDQPTRMIAVLDQLGKPQVRLAPHAPGDAPPRP